MPSQLLSRLALLCAFLLLCCSCAFTRFPTEEQVRSALKPGMTVNEVTALYGTPGGAVNVGGDPDARGFTYLSPIGLRNREEEGYVGFKVFFMNDRLVRWEPINTRPSYDPDLHAREHLMPFAWSYGLVFVAVFIYGLAKAFAFFGSEQRAITEAYKERDIPTRTLPPDFRFINRETTLQEVIDRLGEPTRVTPRVLHGPAAGFRTVEIRPGVSGIITYDYEMPYRAEVVVMLEHPFERANRVRAVYYRRPRTDEA